VVDVDGVDGRVGRLVGAAVPSLGRTEGRAVEVRTGFLDGALVGCVEEARVGGVLDCSEGSATGWINGVGSSIGASSSADGDEVALIDGLRLPFFCSNNGNDVLGGEEGLTETETDTGTDTGKAGGDEDEGITVGSSFESVGERE
jgi:hypothetical protein